MMADLVQVHAGQQVLIRFRSKANASFPSAHLPGTAGACRRSRTAEWGWYCSWPCPACARSATAAAPKVGAHDRRASAYRSERSDRGCAHGGGKRRRMPAGPLRIGEMRSGRLEVPELVRILAALLNDRFRLFDRRRPQHMDLDAQRLIELGLHPGVQIEALFLFCHVHQVPDCAEIADVVLTEKRQLISQLLVQVPTLQTLRQRMLGYTVHRRQSRHGRQLLVSAIGQHRRRGRWRRRQIGILGPGLDHKVRMSPRITSPVPLPPVAVAKPEMWSRWR